MLLTKVAGASEGLVRVWKSLINPFNCVQMKVSRQHEHNKHFDFLLKHFKSVAELLK